MCRIAAPARAIVAIGGLLVFVVPAWGCGPDPLAFPDWTVPVPEGTPEREYRYVPPEERTEQLDFERDLVISEAFGRGLYRPGAVDVADDGTIFVLDTGNHRVVAFDQQGAALREFGRQGEGPGELQRPTGFGVAGDRVIINDTANNRLSVFTSDGELVSDRQFEERFWARTVTGLEGELLMLVAPPTPFGGSDRPPTITWTAGRYSRDGEQLAVFAEREASMKAYFYTPEASGLLPMTYGNPVFAFAPDGSLYVTSGDAYQILAIDAGGTMSWALRTTFVPEAVNEAHRAQARAFRLDSLPETLRAEFADARYVWPAHLAALEDIEIDGRGNLFAFPYTYRPPGVEPGPGDPVAVDVYSSSGDDLFSGLTPISDWDAAFGEHVFRLEEDPVSGEQVVARYRLSGFE